MRPKNGLFSISIPKPKKYVYISDFILMDEYPLSQRKYLLSIQSTYDDINPQNQKLKKSKIRSRKGKKQSKQKKPPGKTRERISRFLKARRLKKKTSSWLMHLLHISVCDKRTEDSLNFIQQLSANSIRKKRPEVMNNLFLKSMGNRMESVSMALLERGFPSDVNKPIFPMYKLEQFEFPSYFILAVALGLSKLVEAMVKKADVNLTWMGLTPLMLSCCSCKNPMKDGTKILSILLSNGANYQAGISLKMYQNFQKLKKAINWSRMIEGFQPIGNAAIACFKSPSDKDGEHVVITAPAISNSGAIDSNTSPPPSNLAYSLTKTIAENNKIRGRSYSGGSKKIKNGGVISHFRSDNSQSGATKDKEKSAEKIQHKEFILRTEIYAMDLAIACEDLDVVKLLLKETSSNSLPFSTMAYLVQQDIELTLFLLKNNIGNFYQPTWRGFYPLHMGCRTGNLEYVILLAKVGSVDLNLPGEHDWTPLHVCVISRKPEIARFLLKCGCKDNIRDKDGLTPKELGLLSGIHPKSLSQYFDKTIVDNNTIQIEKEIEMLLNQFKTVKLPNNVSPGSVLDLSELNSEQVKPDKSTKGAGKSYSFRRIARFGSLPSSMQSIWHNAGKNSSQTKSPKKGTPYEVVLQSIVLQISK